MSMVLASGFQAKLEPFLLMSKSAKGAAAAKLIQDATAAPGVFVFAELLELPNIQELANHEQHSKFYSLLQLFAYKTFADYLQHQDALPPLNPAQVTKLKHLTLVSLAMERRILPYQQLLRLLDMPNIRELEDLIIDAIYQDVIRGKLDQKEQQFAVEYTMGRDLEPGKVETLLAALQNWASTTAAVLATLDEKLVSLSQQAETEKRTKIVYDKQYTQNLLEVQEKQREARQAAVYRQPQQSTQRSGMTAAGKIEREKQEQFEREQREREARERGDSMDVDEPPEGKGKSKKQPLTDSSTRASRNTKRNRF
ncbi:hypothetical protein C8Q75DRAFT_755167 [Abortiporus biennis]|nr:hypothetical protein C8Q75DRAFT_755167 [Abortiporus biennis]